MRLFFLAAFALACSARPVAAQRTNSPRPTTPSAQERIALATRPAEATEAGAPRLACAPLVGQVFDPNGQALVGATLLVKGTHQVYVTDATGWFQLTDPVYQGQVLTLDAAGYVTREVALAECTLPRLVLERDAGARIKRSGKRAGQVTRLDNRSTTLK
ncbi:carboxypeptidase-like regulatory domain-containing protein [Hymenobacter sp.]|uniref:carboxypeptidase-like regulatory domain-containing protein n=1 Tax=Hymenobacter sp. TaxID=1898978 RepID=UPI00286B0CD8|nr:carboxypeptidase-like regulatory domain-containing protein [Hymenobacter sp.]